MAQRTASEVAEMESDLAIYRNENEALKIQLAVASAERDQVKIELALMTARSQDHLIKATQMETILRQTSSALLAGLVKKNQTDAYAEQTRRGIEERREVEQTETQKQLFPIMSDEERGKLRAAIAEAESLEDLKRTTEEVLADTFAPKPQPSSYRFGSGPETDRQRIARLSGAPAAPSSEMQMDDPRLPPIPFAK